MDSSLLHLLQSPDVICFLQKALDQKFDILKCAEILSKSYTPEERKFILDYLTLVPKIREKLDTDAFLFCDKLALEQSTAKDLSLWKSKLWPHGSTIDDLCCGMGGDSIFLHENVIVTGVDLNPERVFMFEKNTALMGIPRKSVLADVLNFSSFSDYFMIDPARRKSYGENQRIIENLTPSFEEILKISNRYKGGMVKLPPGFPLNALPENVEVIYLGKRSDCRECLVLFGELVKNPGKIRVIMLQGLLSNELFSKRDSFFHYLQNHISEAPLNSYIIEPIPLLVRSHLFEDFAEEFRLGILSEGIAYLTGNKPLFHFGFNSFQVLDSCPLTTSAIKAMLKKHQIGKITLKKRGVEVIPEKEIKRLALKGGHEAILFYTRISGEKTAILTQAVENS